MKLNSDLLNEVIADAKAVRETAVQTAISRLKETFEPTVRNLISQKLREEDGEEMDMDTEEAPEMEAPAPAPAPEEEEPVAEEMDDYTDDTYDSVFEEEDYLDNGEEDEELLAQILDELDSEEMYSDLDDETIIPEEEDMDMDTEEGYGSDMSEEELDEMISELEDELSSDVESEDEMEEPQETPVAESRRLKNGRRLRKESTFAWGDEDYDMQDDFGKVISENRQLKRQLQGAKRHLQEAYKAIGTQKKAINEVNLLNSKLLFLTKITSKHQLTPQKQVKILEAFDRAQTVREVKLVYATISESLSRDSKAKARGITESASRPARTVGKSLNEQYEFAPKWKKLAGIL